LKYLVLITF